MDTRDGTIYDSRELAEAAGVPDDDLVTGTREALEKLRKKLVLFLRKARSRRWNQAQRSLR